MIPCQCCGFPLPPHTRGQSFTDPKTGELEHHTVEMATWFAGKDGREPEVIAWHYSREKPGLVTGYQYRTGFGGFDGKGQFCSPQCETSAAATALARHNQGKIEREGQLTRSPTEIARPPAFGKVIPAFITGRRFQQIRYQLELSTDDFGQALGYAGDKEDREAIIRRLESGGRPIPTARGYLAFMFEWFGVPERGK